MSPNILLALMKKGFLVVKAMIMKFKYSMYCNCKIQTFNQI
jgi:hypothetical protein